jgi:hypothetical protein
MGGKLIIATVSAAIAFSGLSTAAYATDTVTVTDERVLTAKSGALDTSPSPAVYLDTNGELFGLPGIRIDDPNADIPDSTFQGQFFETKSGTWLSVAVLNRSTLKPVYVKNYSCPQVVGQTRYDAGEKAAAPCIAAVQKDFTDNKVDEKDLVIASNFGKFGNDQAPYGVIKALKPIGVQPVWWWGRCDVVDAGHLQRSGCAGVLAGPGLPGRRQLVGEGHPRGARDAGPQHAWAV